MSASDVVRSVKILLQNIDQKLIYNIELLRRLKKPVEKLIMNLENLMASVIRTKSCTLEKSEREIRNLVNEAEYALDSYIVCVSLQRAKPRIKTAFNKFRYEKKLRMLWIEMEGVNYRLMSVIHNKLMVDRDELRYCAILQEYDRPKKVYKQRVGYDVVGLEDATEEIIKLLTGEPKHLQIISIVGKLGSGKTTVAKKVLNDPIIEFEFPYRAFVHVSQEYNSRQVFLDILRSLNQDASEMLEMSEEKLATRLRELLKNTKYLIVMDDLREKEDWDRLKVALSRNLKSSRVLITTRKRYVAAHASPSIKPHYLRSLNLEESELLLLNKVFCDNNEHVKVQEYVSCIAAKCDGLPLGILLIAGYLQNNKETVTWWESVAESLKDYNGKDEEYVQKLINWSYNHLPYHLKLCFLYLGVFPMGYEIPVSKLFQLWIAENFVAQEGSMELEDLAEKYLEELVFRNLVIVEKRNHSGRIKTCRIYETLRDFCKNKAREENLFQEIEMANQAFFLSANQWLDDYHVLDYISESMPSGKCVRSFLIFPEKLTLSSKHILSISKAFKLLRVLDVRLLMFTQFPHQLCQLVLLKYFAFSCDFKILPSAMSTLQNLQTLIVETKSRTLEIRSDIWNMTQLRHVYTNASTCLPCPGKAVGINANLQTLSIISLGSCGKDVFRRTPKLKKLGIRGEVALLFEHNNELDSLSQLDFLENLKLLNDKVTVALHILDREEYFPRNLRKLTLLNTMVPWNEMSTLGNLENLEVLKLKDEAFTGDMWQTEMGGFRSLKVLYMERTNLVVWKASAQNFPVLTCLFLKKCYKLEAIPEELLGIPTFQMVDIVEGCPSLVASAYHMKQLKLQEGPSNSEFKLSVYPPIKTIPK